MVGLDVYKAPYIRELEKGLLEEGHFLVKKIHLNVGRSNKPFLRMLLADKTGHLPAVYFGSKQELQQIQASITEGDIVQISGILEDFQGVTQIKLLKIEKDDKSEWELSRFWKRTPHDRRRLYRRLRQSIEQIQDKTVRAVCSAFLRDRNFMRLFLDAPASRFAHHAYIGGLLEHTVHVLDIVLALTRIYQSVDRDLMIAGAFVRKLGKVDEYHFLLYDIDHSSEGKLKGHTLLGYDRLLPKLDEAGLTGNQRLKLEHILLSHQGKRSWGAIEEPRFLEAYLIHAADNLDAMQFLYAEPRRQRGQSAQPAEWSDFIHYLGRDIYLG